MGEAGWLQRLDADLSRRVSGGWGHRADQFFKGVTELGSIAASIGASVALSLAGRRRAAVDALGAAGATWVVAQALKRMVVRPRPYDAMPDVRLSIAPPRGTSWPSSHPAVLLAYLTVATRDLEVARPARAAAVCLSCVVGISRVYLGVHYPSDVAGGLVVGRGVGNLWSRSVSPLVARLWDRPSRLQ